MRVVVKISSLAVACGIACLSVLGFASEISEANRLFVLEKYEDANRIYEGVVSRGDQKEAPEAFFGLGRAYQFLGQWERARQNFERIFRDYPDSDLVPVAKIQIGQCEIRLGNLKRALLLFEEIEKSHPGQDAAVDAIYNAANLNAGFFGDDVMNTRVAMRRYRVVLESGKANRYAVQSYFGLGQCYALLGDYWRAVDAFRAVLREGPNTVWAGYARDQIANAVKSLQKEPGLSPPMEPPAFWLDLQSKTVAPLETRERVDLHFSVSPPMLRVRAVGFFTESQDPNSGAEKVFYWKPTIYYKGYVFNCDRGTVNRAQRFVECVGNVKCTDDMTIPTLTVTSGALTLDLGKNKAIFSRDVRLEKREGDKPAQQLMVGELHLLLDSGNIEVPAQ